MMVHAVSLLQIDVLQKYWEYSFQIPQLVCLSILTISVTCVLALHLLSEQGNAYYMGREQ